MSVINQMLKDLAHRSKPLSESDGILADLVVTVNETATRNKFNYGMIVLSVLFLLIIYYSLLKTPAGSAQMVAADTPIQNTSIVEIQPLQIKRENVPLLPLFNQVSLTGITLQVEKDITSTRLLLNQNTLYRVVSNTPDQLIIILENTRLATSLPQIDTASSAINLFRIMNQQDGSLKIIFKLNPGVELSHLDMQNSAKFSELQVEFSSKNMVDSIQTAEEQQTLPIKKISYDSSMNEEYQKIENLINLGQIGEAVVGLNQFLKKYPNHVAARKSLAIIFMQTSNYSKALDLINVGLQQQPMFLPFLQLKAEILTNQGKIKQALNVLQMYSPPFEENSEYYSFIAALLERQHKFSEAINLYERLLNLQPTNSIWWSGLGIAFENIGRKSEALAAFQKANNDTLSAELKTYVESRLQALS